AGPAHRRRIHGPRHRRIRRRHAAPGKADAIAMWTGTPLFPESPSTRAPRVDALYFFLLAVTAVFSLLIAGLIVYYAVKYRRRSPKELGHRIPTNYSLEIAWTVIPFAITMVMFIWGAK